MSLRSRARSIQKLAGVTFGRAQGLIRSLRERPALQREAKGWALGRCDAYLLGLVNAAGSPNDRSTLRLIPCAACATEFFAPWHVMSSLRPRV